MIDTPQGRIPVEDLRVGDPVWTINATGERIAATILRTSKVPIPVGQQVLRILLSDGRQLSASAGHPAADGRLLGDLREGDPLDGGRVILIERIANEGASTYDILPSGNTGFYWANGILLGSTLIIR
jgi:hypothetical protein